MEKNQLKNLRKIKNFGYGPQADRYLLNDHRNKYGNNVSNTILYALLSGGYFSLVVMITIFSYTLYLAYKFVINNKILIKKVTISKKNIFIILALTYVIFFGIRSFFENSFGLFSIDYMLVVLSLFTLESKIFENS